MAYYKYNCCFHGEFNVVKPIAESSRPELCPHCDEIGKRVYTALPGHGLSDGPGTAMSNRPHKPIFDLVDPHNDVPYTYNRLMADGKFDKNPEFKKNMDLKMSKLKERPREIVDYQKVGHPIER